MSGAGAVAVPAHVMEIMGWVAKQLPPEQGSLISAGPATFRIQIGGLGEVLFCHATPRSDTEVFTRLTPEASLLPIF